MSTTPESNVVEFPAAGEIDPNPSSYLAEQHDATVAADTSRRTRKAKDADLVFVPGVGTVLPAPKAKAARTPRAAKAPKAEAPAAPKLKTWTQTAIEVRQAVAEIKALMGDEAKGLKVLIATRVAPRYADTLSHALEAAAKVGNPSGTTAVEKGTNLPEVRKAGYVAHLQFARRSGDVVSTWIVWLSADGPVLLTRDGEPVAK